MSTVGATTSASIVCVTNSTAADHNQILTSKTARTWSNTADPASSSQLGALRWGNGLWVVAGTQGVGYWTRDYTASSWSSISSLGISAAQALAIAYGGSYWTLAYNSGAGIRYATDPTGSWSAPTSTGFASGAGSVGYLNGYYLAAKGGIRYATDPTGTWGTATLSPTTTSAMEGEWAYGTASSGTAYYVKTADASGTARRIYYATDPTGTWTGVTAGFTATVVRGLAYGNGYFVAGGTNEIRYATDPTGTWGTASSPGITNYIFNIRYFNGLWVASGQMATTGYPAIYYATDPTGTWTQAFVGTVGSLFAWGLEVVTSNTPNRSVSQSVHRAAVF